MISYYALNNDAKNWINLFRSSILTQELMFFNKVNENKIVFVCGSTTDKYSGHKEVLFYTFYPNYMNSDS